MDSNNIIKGNPFLQSLNYPKSTIHGILSSSVDVLCKAAHIRQIDTASSDIVDTL